jgi:tRNA modification GTPase
MLAEQFEARGVRPCSWQTFGLLVSNDRIAARAAGALASALTVRTAAILLDQQQGAMARALEQLLLLWQEGRDREASLLLGGLNRWTKLGGHLTTPWRVAVCGPPNVGKSSLVNALAGFQRSIVTEIPGTTRDVVTTLIAVDGWPVELADTAGLREGAGALERQGMELTHRAAAEADLCVWVLDASRPPIWPDAPSEKTLLVVNKTDLSPAWDLAAAQTGTHVSAAAGAGLPLLCQAIAEALVPQAPMPGEPVPFTAGLCSAVNSADRLCTERKIDMAKKVLQDACESLGDGKSMPS